MLVGIRYASVVAIESTSKVDDEQWLAYWILYSFLTLMEMLLQPLLEWYSFIYIYIYEYDFPHTHQPDIKLIFNNNRDIYIYY